jgi:hypothetical protein
MLFGRIRTEIIDRLLCHISAHSLHMISQLQIINVSIYYKVKLTCRGTGRNRLVRERPIERAPVECLTTLKRELIVSSSFDLVQRHGSTNIVDTQVNGRLYQK